MSDLIVIAYQDTFRAAEVLNDLRKLQREHLIDLEDACVVTRDVKGKIKLHQAVELTAAGVISGGFWGALIGLLFFNPLLGMAVGMGAGGLGGMLTDYGIDDGFIKELGAKLEPGTSALFILVRQMTPDKVLAELATFGGQVLQTSFSAEQEAQIAAALNSVPTLNIPVSPQDFDPETGIVYDSTEKTLAAA
jgi:uncharacterized membrane protein